MMMTRVAGRLLRIGTIVIVPFFAVGSALPARIPPSRPAPPTLNYIAALSGSANA